MPTSSGSGNRLSWLDHQAVVGGPVERSMWLSQFGRLEDGQMNFRPEPRWDRELALSMTMRKRSAAEMGMLVRRMTPPELKRKNDLVRWFVAGDLLDAGYRVVHTPRVRNPEHVSIAAGLPDHLHRDESAHRAWWSSPERGKLDDLAQGMGGFPE